MKKNTLAVFSLIILSACAPAVTPSPKDEPEILPSTQTPVGQFVNYHPLDTTTGIEEIDIILSAVANGDPQELVKLFSFSRVGCMTVHALGGLPPCLESEAEGTLVEVLPSLGGEGSYLRKTEIGNFPGLNVIGL